MSFRLPLSLCCAAVAAPRLHRLLRAPEVVKARYGRKRACGQPLFLREKGQCTWQCTWTMRASPVECTPVSTVAPASSFSLLSLLTPSPSWLSHSRLSPVVLVTTSSKHSWPSSFTFCCCSPVALLAKLHQRRLLPLAGKTNRLANKLQANHGCTITAARSRRPWMVLLSRMSC